MITTDGNNAISGGGKSIMVQTEMPLGQVSKTSTGEVNWTISTPGMNRAVQEENLKHSNEQWKHWNGIAKGM